MRPVNANEYRRAGVFSRIYINNKNTTVGVFKIAADHSGQGKPQHCDKHDRRADNSAVSPDISFPPACPPLPASRHPFPPMLWPVFPVDLRMEDSIVDAGEATMPAGSSLHLQQLTGPVAHGWIGHGVKMDA